MGFYLRKPIWRECLCD